MPQTRHCELYARQASKTFTRLDTDAGVNELTRYLRAVDRDTSLFAITDPDELRLQQTGVTVKRGFRFTAAAFKQASQVLAPGLSKFLPDIAGTVHRRGVGDKPYGVDGDFAIRTWNQLVTMRFNLFERFRAIRNEQDRTIDGFVSHRHQYLGNASLYTEAMADVATQSQDISVFAAKLTGRQFSLWFREDVPRFKVPVDGQSWSFYGGLYFTNGEATGTSVRGTAAVLTPRGVCLSPYRKHGRRITHSGREFMIKLSAMIATVAQTELPWDKIEAGVRGMLTTSLGFADDSTDEQRRERTKRIVHMMSALGVQRSIAVDVMDLALAAGRYAGMATTPWAQVQQLYSGRTTLDILVPLLQAARRVDTIRREKLEQAAFEIMMGRFIQ